MDMVFKKIRRSKMEIFSGSNEFPTVYKVFVRESSFTPKSNVTRKLNFKIHSNDIRQVMYWEGFIWTFTKAWTALAGWKIRTASYMQSQELQLPEYHGWGGIDFSSSATRAEREKEPALGWFAVWSCSAQHSDEAELSGFPFCFFLNFIEMSQRHLIKFNCRPITVIASHLTLH